MTISSCARLFHSAGSRRRVFGQPAEAGDQVLDGFALAFAAQRHAVARADGARVQVVAALQIDDRLVQLLIGLALFVQFRLNVEHVCFLA